MSYAGSSPAPGTKLIAGIQAIGQSHKLGPEDSNSSSATSFRMLTANIFNFKPNGASGSIPASGVMVAHPSKVKRHSVVLCVVS